MSRWTQNQLDRIDGAQELTLASARGDGTLRRPVTMWVVRDEVRPSLSDDRALDPRGRTRARPR